MKKLIKLFKASRNSLMYVAIYFLVGLLVDYVYMYWLKSTTSLAEAEIYRTLRDGTYSLGVIASVLSVWIFIIIGYVRKKPFAKTVEFRHSPPIVMMMSACIAIGARLVVSGYSHFAMGIKPLKNSIETAQSYAPEINYLYQALIALFAVSIIAPIFEEIMFRGLIMNELMSVLRPWAAILLQALVFGVAHGSLFQSSFSFVIGILLGIIYYRTKSIMAATVCHGVFNFSAVFSAVELNNTSATVITILGVLLVISSCVYIIQNCNEK